jgi:hypothetical protein
VPQAREGSLIRATELCDRVGDQRELLGLLFQHGQFYIQRLRWGEARQLGACPRNSQGVI